MEMKSELTKILALATYAATAGAGTPRAATPEAGKRGRKHDGLDLLVGPHCGKNGKNKPEDCFSLPANAGKKPATFTDGNFVTEKKAE